METRRGLRLSANTEICTTTLIIINMTGGEQNEKLMETAKQGTIDMELEELKPSLLA